MARPRSFDEIQVIGLAAEVFATQSYAGTSIDELVTRLGVHRNSLYKAFGSKRGLYLAALRHSLSYDVRPLLEQLATAGSETARLEAARQDPSHGVGLDLVLLALAEQAPVDREVARLAREALAGLDEAGGGPEFTNRVIGERLRARVRDGDDQA